MIKTGYDRSGMEANPKTWLTAEQIRVLTGRRTQEVWRCFSDDEWRTAADVQQRLSFESKAVYYQLRKLALAGLLISDASQKAVRYRRASSAIAMPDGYQGEVYEQLAAKLAGASLRHSIRQFERTARLAPEKPDLVDRLSIFEMRLRLEDSRIDAFKDRLREIEKELRRFSSPEGKEVRLVLVLTPEFD